VSEILHVAMLQSIETLLFSNSDKYESWSILSLMLSASTPLNDSKQSPRHRNATQTPDAVSSKLSGHAVSHVNRFRACCHSCMH
jgi:hypothetical protein